MSIKSVIYKDREFEHFSPSQLSTHARCRRRWWLSKISNLPKVKATAAMLKGTGVHKVLEARLLTAKWLEIESIKSIKGVASGKLLLGIAQSHGDRLFPKTPVPRAFIERKIKVNSAPTARHIQGVPCEGVADWVEFSANRVNDHKTLSRAIFVKTIKELGGDPQAIMYGIDAVENLNFVYPVKFRHIYYPTTSKASPVTSEVSLTQAMLEDERDKIQSRILLMEEDGEITHTNQVIPNILACNDYGKCDFFELCTYIGDIKVQRIRSLASDVERKKDAFDSITLNSTNTGDTMSLFDKLKKRQEEERKNAELGIKPPKKKQAQNQFEELEDIEDNWDDSKNDDWGGEEDEGINPSLPSPSETSPVKKKKKKKKNILALQELAVSLGGVIGTTGSKKAKEPGIVTEYLGREPAHRDDSLAHHDDLTLKAALGIKPGKSIPPADPKDADNPYGTVTLGQMLKDDATESKANAKANSSREHKTSKENRAKMLFVDCIPRNKEVVYFDVWIHELVEKTLIALRAKHYNLPPWDYGKGAAEVATALRVNLESNPSILPKYMVIFKRHPLFNGLFDELVQHYSDVVERLG